MFFMAFIKVFVLFLLARVKYLSTYIMRRIIDIMRLCVSNTILTAYMLQKNIIVYHQQQISRIFSEHFPVIRAVDAYVIFSSKSIFLSCQLLRINHSTVHLIRIYTRICNSKHVHTCKYNAIDNKQRLHCV